MEEYIILNGKVLSVECLRNLLFDRKMSGKDERDLKFN